MRFSTHWWSNNEDN